MTRVGITIVTLVLAGTAAPIGAAVLLPGNVVVAARDQLLLIDPGRRAPEVVSSPSVGGGVPFGTIFDFDFGTDGFIYALVDARNIIRIDPATGDRELVSSPTRGAGLIFAHARALEVARDGTIYVGDTQGGASPVRRHVVVSVDPISGDRTQRFEVAVSGTNASVWDLAELDDGRILIAAGASGETRGVWVANLSTGARSGPFGAFRDAPRSIASQPGTNRVFAIDGVPSLRIIDIAYGPGSALREVASCERQPASFALSPNDVVIDEAGFLVVAAAERSGTCSLSGFPSLSGHIYRVDPITGTATLLYESEIVYLGAAFARLRLVPADHPFDDRDGDGLADVIDKCPSHVDPDQRDLDGDGIGDACNDAEDFDGDEIADTRDLCPDTSDPLQSNADDDDLGDACDPFPDDANNAAAALRVTLSQVRGELQACLVALHGDEDGDGIADPRDDCPVTAPGALVDSQGCSLVQFCTTFALYADCVFADWQDDEDTFFPFDCRRRHQQCLPW